MAGSGRHAAFRIKATLLSPILFFSPILFLSITTQRLQTVERHRISQQLPRSGEAGRRHGSLTRRWPRWSGVVVGRDSDPLPTRLTRERASQQAAVSMQVIVNLESNACARWQDCS
ncbi:uncharacterized protein B0T15DRAFT_186609 [Chaetomium strumarium]|uniref:Uncharacterized protein n=1 Tax=Chaetomium strumarium TaxID=1170767 RepID=A0AAJ0GRV8_9PEZI|nr:hypothetical protein B0T15DRAFT_186609 [Chaetomium strumarium]